jgi:hypothetical protein
MNESLNEILKKKEELEKKIHTLISETFLQITENLQIIYNPEKELVIFHAYRTKTNRGFTVDLPKQKISELIKHLSFILDNY